MSRRICSIGRVQDGAVVVEFALVLPLMLILLFGSIVVAQVFRAYMRLSQSADALVDLVAQQINGVTSGTTSTSSLANFCVAAKYVMTPFSTSGTAGKSGAYSAAVASITNASGTATKNWEIDSSCVPVSATALGTAASLASPNGTNLVPNAGDSLIVVEVSYVYGPPFTGFSNNWGLSALTAPITLTQITYARPRGNATIPCTVGTTVTACP